MADGVTILNASGVAVTVATDDTGATGHAQLWKLAVSADGSPTLVPADATDGLLVNLGANNDVTLAAVVPGTGATNLGKAIDSPVGSTDTGVAMLAKRKDTPATITPADGDYNVPITDSRGILWTTSADPGHEYTEDAASSSGDFGSLILGIRNQDGASLTSADLDYGGIAIDGAGRQIVTERPPIELIFTPTLDTGAYASGDSLWTTVVTLTNAHPRNGGWLRVLECYVLDKSAPSGANNPAPVDLLFFSASITPTTANSPSAISDADMANYIGFLTVGSYTVNTTNAGGQRNEPGVYLHLGSGTTSLYVAGISKGTATWGASDLVFHLICAPFA